MSFVAACYGVLVDPTGTDTTADVDFSVTIRARASVVTDISVPGPVDLDLPTFGAVTKLKADVLAGNTCVVGRSLYMPYSVSGAAPSTWPSPQPVHTGRSNWVKIDTTGLWVSQGGSVAPGTLVTIDGAAAASEYTQPTAANPAVAWLLPIKTLTLGFGPYTWTSDIIWRGYPVIGYQDDASADTNATYYGGNPPIDTAVPNAGNSFNAGAAYRDREILNNGYSQVLDPGGHTYTYCIAPGDKYNYPVGDCRAQPRHPDAYDDDMPGAPLTTGGSDLFGNGKHSKPFSVRFWRYDYMIPHTWTAPVPVENVSRAAYRAYLAANGYTNQWPNNTTINPTTGDYTASDTVTNVNTGTLLSFMENYGPATFKWAAANGGGNLLRHSLQPHTFNVLMKALYIDSLTWAFDTWYNTIIELRYDFFAYGNGIPWIVAPGVITPPNSVSWSDTYPCAPYGTPLKSDNLTPNPPYGGGYIRAFRWQNKAPYGNCWVCMTDHAITNYSIDGECPIYDANGNILNSGTYDVDAGKIFGGFLKYNSSTLATGPGGASGVVIPAAATPPFDITVADTPNMMHYDGIMWIGAIGTKGEWFEYDVWTSGTKNIHVTARAQRGTTASNHSVTDLVACIQAWPSVISGLNQSDVQVYPFCGRSHPILTGSTFKSICGAPSSTYP